MIQTMTVGDWVKKEQSKHRLCACGCGEEITIKKQHHKKSKKIPKYINGHHNRGLKFSKKTKQKMSDSKKGKPRSEKTKQKISNTSKGKILTEDHKRKIGMAGKGRKHSDKSKIKMSESSMGHFVSIETRKRMSKKRKGNNHYLYGKYQMEETKQKIALSKTGTHHSKETILKMSGENNHNWNNGSSFEPYCNKFNENLKQRVRYFFGNVCFLCGKTQEENRQKLSVHHVNYDKMICCNDVEPLFVPLCHICHSKTGNKRMDYESYFEKRLNDEYNSKCFYTIEEFNHIQEVSA